MAGSTVLRHRQVLRTPRRSALRRLPLRATQCKSQAPKGWRPPRVPPKGWHFRKHCSVRYSRRLASRQPLRLGVMSFIGRSGSGSGGVAGLPSAVDHHLAALDAAQLGRCLRPGVQAAVGTGELGLARVDALALAGVQGRAALDVPAGGKQLVSRQGERSALDDVVAYLLPGAPAAGKPVWLGVSPMRSIMSAHSALW